MSDIGIKTSKPHLSVAILEEPSRTSSDIVACVIGINILFDYRILETYCAASLEPIVYDLMVIVAAIEFSDRYKSRSVVRWSRQINLSVPVDNPSHWSSPVVSSSLKKALELLTGDAWNFTFFQRVKEYSQLKQSLLELPVNASRVMAFSDGLDSRSVALIEESLNGLNSLIKVRIGDKGKDIKDKRAFAAVPFGLRFPRLREASFRSRSFKFAAISAIAAYLSKINRIIVPESGQGALGPVLLPLRSQFPDYRNHPVFFRKMEVFIQALLGYSVQYLQPRLWSTKGETVNAAREAGASDDALINTRSCWQKRHFVSFDGKLHQCGVCAACILRRVSLYSAGLSDQATSFSVTNLDSASFKKASPKGFLKKDIETMKSHAVAGVLHFDDLANLSHGENSQLLDSHSLEIAKATDIEHKEARNALSDLLHRHNAEWQNFLSSLNRDSFLKKWTQGVEQ